MTSIAIVTDSTCDIPPSTIETLPITIVPLIINMQNKSYQDRIELSREDFYERLPFCNPHPTTSTPNISAFLQVYEKLAEQGFEQVLSIHISEKLSSTIEIARVAAKECIKIPVTVYDSGQLSLGLGYIVLEAAKAAQASESMENIFSYLNSYCSRVYVFAVADTLEYLSRSGRMKSAVARLGNMLKIKPLLKMNNGNPTVERVRTHKEALKRLIDLIQNLGELDKFAFLHTNATKYVEELYHMLMPALKANENIWAVDVTPVLGAHLGPGVVGAACVRY